jgi:hypothetical protein
VRLILRERTSCNEMNENYNMPDFAFLLLPIMFLPTVVEEGARFLLCKRSDFCVSAIPVAVLLLFINIGDGLEEHT